MTEAPSRRICAYAHDEDGHWVAILDCGHRQHLRDEPPFSARPWVHDEGARAARIGAPLPCLRCQRWEAPSALRLRRATREFAEGDVPSAILRAHSTAEGVWARVLGRGGQVVIIAEARGDRPETTVALAEGDALLIPPAWPHRAAPGPGGRFLIELCEPAPPQD